MSDEVEQIEVEEQQNGHEAVDTTVENDQSEGHENEGESSEEKVEEKPKFEPWKMNKEKKVADHVPYDRFREVNTEKNEYARKVNELEEQLAKYTKREQELAAIKTPDDIKISDYDDPEEYLKARDNAIKNQAIKEVEERFIAREQERLVAEKNEQITNNYLSNLENSYKRNPEIKEVVTWFDQYANNLHPDVAYELLVDENVGELIYQCSTDQSLLTMLFKGDPKEVIRKLHKMSAKIETTPVKNQSQSQSSKTEEVPQAREKKIGIPTVVKGGKTPSKRLEDMSMSEYREYVAKRDGKRR